MSATDGSSTITAEKRRASAASRSISRYSASVVAPIIRSVPRARRGFSMLAASIAPSAPPAPSTVCSSSTNRITRPSACSTSASRACSRCSKAPRNCVPATIPARSSAITRTSLSIVRDLTSGDPQREALGDRRLTDTGLTDQDRVVLTPAAEDLDDLLDLRVAADHGVDAPVARVSGEVVAEVIEGCRLGRLSATCERLRRTCARGRARRGGGRCRRHPWPRVRTGRRQRRHAFRPAATKRNCATAGRSPQTSQRRGFAGLFS